MQVNVRATAQQGWHYVDNSDHLLSRFLYKEFGFDEPSEFAGTLFV